MIPVQFIYFLSNENQYKHKWETVNVMVRKKKEDIFYSPGGKTINHAFTYNSGRALSHILLCFFFSTS